VYFTSFGQQLHQALPARTCRLTFNTGLFAVRNRPASRSFLHAWATMLTDSEQQRDSDRTKRRIDDQLALNLLLDVVLVSVLGPSE
jgi:hypothetical protein